MLAKRAQLGQAQKQKLTFGQHEQSDGFELPQQDAHRTEFGETLRPNAFVGELKVDVLDSRFRGPVLLGTRRRQRERALPGELRSVPVSGRAGQLGLLRKCFEFLACVSSLQDGQAKACGVKRRAAVRARSGGCGSTTFIVAIRGRSSRSPMRIEKPGITSERNDWFSSRMTRWFSENTYASRPSIAKIQTSFVPHSGTAAPFS